MKSKTRSNLFVLTECSIMIALSTVLSIFKLFEMPYGGSVTLASFLPIVILSYRHGMRAGIPSALLASLIQLLLGLKNFSYFTSWYSLVALALFDYIFAFAVFGLCGMFKKIIRKQSLSIVMGTLFASVIRYICHVISGATIWAGLSIPTKAATLYSLSYNATYMLPEALILILCALYIGSSLNLDAKIPTRIKSEKLDSAAAYSLISAGLVALGTLIADTVLVFSKLQNAESGEFDITLLSSVNWLAILIVTLSGFAVVTSLVIFSSYRAKRK